MERYDYADAVRNDCEDRIKEIIEYEQFDNYGIDVNDYDDFEEFKEALSEKITDNLVNSDSVTGAGSGSYYCNAWKAEESICHNLDLLKDVCNEWDLDLGETISSAEGADVTIRQYMVYQEIDNAIDNVEEELEQYFDEKKAELDIDKE